MLDASNVGEKQWFNDYIVEYLNFGVHFCLIFINRKANQTTMQNTPFSIVATVKKYVF
jgi:uncharacterized protein YutD